VVEKEAHTTVVNRGEREGRVPCAWVCDLVFLAKICFCSRLYCVAILHRVQIIPLVCDVVNFVPHPEHPLRKLAAHALVQQLQRLRGLVRRELCDERRRRKMEKWGERREKGLWLFFLLSCNSPDA
jgi:hypothetical protein